MPVTAFSIPAVIRGPSTPYSLQEFLEGWGGVLVGLLAVAILVWVVAQGRLWLMAARVRARVRLRAPLMRVRAPEDVPAFLPAALAELDEELASFGFEPVAWLEVRAEVVGQDHWRRLYYHPGERCYAFASAAHFTDARACPVAFLARFKGGERLLTADGGVLEPLGPLPRTRRLEPLANTPQALWAGHRRTAREMTRSLRRPPEPLAVGELLAEEAELAEEALAGLRRRGAIAPEGGGGRTEGGGGRRGLDPAAIHRFRPRAALALAREVLRADRLQRSRPAPPEAPPGDAPAWLDALEADEYGRLERLITAPPAPFRTKLAWFLGSMALFSLSLFAICPWAWGGLLAPGEHPVALLLGGGLVGTLLVHELGHLLGMWYWRFRDLRLIFLPFLGAATIGVPDRALGVGPMVAIYLLGPIPGIWLGAALAVGGTLAGWASLVMLGYLMVFLNAMNMIPLVPLDGGQILHLTLFARYPRVKLAFLALSVGLNVLPPLLMVAFALLTGDGLADMIAVLPLLLLTVPGALLLGLGFPEERRKIAVVARARARAGGDVLGEAAAVPLVLGMLREAPFGRLRFPHRAHLARAAVEALGHPMPTAGQTALWLSVSAAGLFPPLAALGAVAAWGPELPALTEASAWVPDQGPRLRWPAPPGTEVQRPWREGMAGVDLHAAAGTPVYAPEAGTLIQVRRVRGNAFTLVLAHDLPGGAWTTTLGGVLPGPRFPRPPADGTAATPRLAVRRGEVLGMVADLGPATHLHFGVSQGPPEPEAWQATQPWRERLSRDPSCCAGPDACQVGTLLPPLRRPWWGAPAWQEEREGSPGAGPLSAPRDLVAEPGGAVWTIDRGTWPRRIGPDGLLSTPAFREEREGVRSAMGLALGPSGPVVLVRERRRRGVDRDGPPQVALYRLEGGKTWAPLALPALPSSALAAMTAVAQQAPGLEARLPLAVDGRGRLYLTDGRRIFRGLPGGRATLVAGSGETGMWDGPGPTAAFGGITAMALSERGDLYVVDASPGEEAPEHPYSASMRRYDGLVHVRRVAASGAVATLAGGLQGHRNGFGAVARFASGCTLVAPPGGQVYLADARNRCVRRLSPEGFVTTVAGSPPPESRQPLPPAPHRNGRGAEVAFERLGGIAADASGTLYVLEEASDDMSSVGPCVRTLSFR